MLTMLQPRLLRPAPAADKFRLDLYWWSAAILPGQLYKETCQLLSHVGLCACHGGCCG
jgi:hypothetical protein